MRVSAVTQSFGECMPDMLNHAEWTISLVEFELKSTGAYLD